MSQNTAATMSPAAKRMKARAQQFWGADLLTPAQGLPSLQEALGETGQWKAEAKFSSYEIAHYFGLGSGSKYTRGPLCQVEAAGDATFRWRDWRRVLQQHMSEEHSKYLENHPVWRCVPFGTVSPCNRPPG